LVARMRGDARARARREQRAWRARGRGSAEVVGEAVAGPRRGESAARREAESTSVDGRTRVRRRTAATHACSVCVKRALYARARVQGAEQREGAQATQWRPRCAPFVRERCSRTLTVREHLLFARRTFGSYVCYNETRYPDLCFLNFSILKSSMVARACGDALRRRTRGNAVATPVRTLRARTCARTNHARTLTFGSYVCYNETSPF
jgi:hypothetical protein